MSTSYVGHLLMLCTFISWNTLAIEISNFSFVIIPSSKHDSPVLNSLDSSRSRMQCIVLCVNHPDCISVNFKMPICEMLGSANLSMLQTQPDWQFICEYLLIKYLMKIWASIFMTKHGTQKNIKHIPVNMLANAILDAS